MAGYVCSGMKTCPRLKTIECLKKTGMPIKAIKHFMACCIQGDSTIEERLSIIKSQRDAVILQMKELQEMFEMLNYKCWYYETAKASGTCSVHDTDKIQLERIPEEYHRFINE